ncbi:RDD family protein [Marinoscillum furvescens]|uniref:Putative RDD family membrane protein YckC n=1 Tax=Marinoscillum furvescens DSM 4134 TaxID=1122208 RepID=A0A3D9L8J6_MARFU|nr:RDD family protein [Marinoscillum furvescens]REE01606.1 putative RDD family membrane protein YckC [Marinoscillum furvescens DSM 4134]
MTETQYAGFWLRFVAYLIDGIVVGIVQSFIITPFLALFGLSLTAMESMDYMSEEESIAAIIGMASGFGGIILVSAIVGIAYYTLMEASKYQATLGKMALGLKVTDEAGQPLDLGKSLLRNLGKIVSQLIFMIGYIMAGLTAKKQALHDMMAGALVIKK